MAATTAGAIKAYVETLNLGLTVYRDGSVPVDPPYPHLVVQEGLAYDVEQSGDYGDPDADQWVTELVQCDLFQLARRPTTTGRTENVEDYTLADTLRSRLRGARIGPVGVQRVAGVTPFGGRRWPIADNVVRHTIDLRVRREQNRSV